MDGLKKHKGKIIIGLCVFFVIDIAGTIWYNRRSNRRIEEIEKKLEKVQSSVLKGGEDEFDVLDIE